MNESFFSKYRALIFLVFLSLLVVGGVSYQLIFSQKKAGVPVWIANGIKPGGSTITSTLTGGKLAMTTLNVRPEKNMNIRGYEMRVPFDSKKIRITGIKYLLGIVSQGIGDDNTSLDAVNTRGYVKIMAEIQSPTGKSLSVGTSTPAVEVTAMIKGSTGRFTLVPAATILYEIAPDGGLTPAPGK